MQRTTTAPATAKNASCRLPSAEPMPPFSPALAEGGADDDAAQIASSVRPLCTLACGESMPAASTLQRPLLSAPVVPAGDVPAHLVRCPAAELAVQALRSDMPMVATQATAAEPRLPDALLSSVTREVGDVPDVQHPSSADTPLPLPEPAQPHTDAGQHPGQTAEVAAVGATPGGLAPPQPQQPDATVPKSACGPLIHRQKVQHVHTEPAGATAQMAASVGRVRDASAMPTARTRPHCGARDRKVNRDEMGLDSIDYNRMMRRKKEEEAAAQPAASAHGGALPDASQGAADTNGAGDRRLLADGEMEDQLTRARGSEPNSNVMSQQTNGKRKKLRAKRLSAKQVSRSCDLAPTMRR